MKLTRLPLVKPKILFVLPKANASFQVTGLSVFCRQPRIMSYEMCDKSLNYSISV